jgi:restriction system protein
MPIPDFQTVMLPILKDLASGERSSQQTHDALASFFALTPEELVMRIPSSRAKTFQNRLG